MRLLLDEMYPARVAEQLRKRGRDVAAVDERPELRTLEDEALLLSATAEDRVLVTENVADFPSLVSAFAEEGRAHCGVILVPRATFPRTDRGFGALVRALDALLAQGEGGHAIPGGLHWLRAR